MVDFNLWDLQCGPGNMARVAVSMAAWYCGPDTMARVAASVAAWYYGEARSTEETTVVKL